MNKADLNKLMDLIEEIKKVDAMILLHENLDDANFMGSQYEAKKTQLISNLIDELVSPPIQSPQSFSLIQRIIDRFYPILDKDKMKYDNEIAQLAAAI
jgi:hypothetical protein